MIPTITKNYDWRVCANGSVIEGTVIQAVTDFRQKYGITKFWTIYEQGGTIPSFYFQKPYN